MFRKRGPGRRLYFGKWWKNGSQNKKVGEKSQGHKEKRKESWEGTKQKPKRTP